MSKSYNVLIMGASYGSLLGTKLLLGGHSVTLVCTSNTAQLINQKGTVVRLPVRGRDELVSVASSSLEAQLDATTPDKVELDKYDLVVLGMQEPQYSSPGVRDLLVGVARAKLPCMAIMNMPPLPFLRRIPGLDVATLETCYLEPGLWSEFEPDLVTLASPDPQAFRPSDEEKNVLQVSLPTNFKVATFGSDTHTDMLVAMQDAIMQARFSVADESLELPVKLKVHDSLFVPLAKWSMERLGASTEDMVPFEKYAKAASGLSKPSSGARALFGGAKNIERVDKLVQKIAQQQGMNLPTLDETVAFVDSRLEKNRV